MADVRLDRNTGLDLVRATEAAAMSAGRWMGLGQRGEAERAAGDAMWRALKRLDINGRIVVSEEARTGTAGNIRSGQLIGTGRGVPIDMVIDPVDGQRLLAQGRPGAIAVAAVAARGAIWSPEPAAYMEKLVVNQEVADALVPECFDAPAAWTLALVARAKAKAVRDLVIFVLERPRHAHLIDEIRAAGARVMLADDGDIAGAVLAASPQGRVDLLMGIGGATEGVIAACAVKAMGGAMLARLAPQHAEETAAITAAGLDMRRILDCNDMVSGSQIYFVATGITDGPLLDGVRYHGNRAETHSLIMRSETHTRRLIHAEHLLDDTH